MKATLANSLWLASCWASWNKFARSSHHVAETQQRILSGILKTNENTEFGKRFDFGRIANPSAFESHVPLSGYDDYVEPIGRIAGGRTSVLTAEPVRRFELSSGSTAASKLIPYTSGLSAEFQRGILPWIYDLFTGMSELMNGTAYWSITPLVEGKQFTESGIPIGFENDSEYLGPLGSWLLNSVLAVPDSVKGISNIDSFRYVTLLHLLRQPNLRLISVWNPTYLSLLLDALPEHWDSLIQDIASGWVTPPNPLDEKQLRLEPLPNHAEELAQAGPTAFEQIWPKLRLVSCWSDGPSAAYAKSLRQSFKRTAFQGKGLIATEAFVSFPLLGWDGAVLAINSHFYEFIPTDGGKTALAHELIEGQSYSVVVTTGGGLYRYQLHDVVQVVGHWNQVPRLVFLGKADHVSDWFGEKLDERFVTSVVNSLIKKNGIQSSFSMLAPDDPPEGFCYILYLDADGTPPDLAENLDFALRSNFHFDFCRKLGQIGATRVVRVSDGANKYLRACQERGQRLGNVKSTVLQKDLGWSGWLGPQTGEPS